jgi:hypothetical protein
VLTLTQTAPPREGGDAVGVCGESILLSTDRVMFSHSAGDKGGRVLVIPTLSSTRSTRDGERAVTVLVEVPPLHNGRRGEVSSPMGDGEDGVEVRSLPAANLPQKGEGAMAVPAATGTPHPGFTPGADRFQSSAGAGLAGGRGLGRGGPCLQLFGGSHPCSALCGTGALRRLPGLEPHRPPPTPGAGQ